MTREQAEAAGWQFSDPVNSEGLVNIFEASAIRAGELIVFHGSQKTIAERGLLDRITAIESYPSAVALLEECKRLLIRMPSGYSHKDVTTLLAKLEVL